jgi:hypothetical protein
MLNNCLVMRNDIPSLIEQGDMEECTYAVRKYDRYVVTSPKRHRYNIWLCLKEWWATFLHGGKFKALKTVQVESQANLNIRAILGFRHEYLNCEQRHEDMKIGEGRVIFVPLNTVAYTPIARQRPRNKQRDNSRC